MDDDFGARDEDDWATYDDVDLLEMTEKLEREDLTFPPQESDDSGQKF